ncbi:unnamed protein product [Parnassius apollo]|uniref:(apollo) hypothetical protein n=1 Tax=Parnassius apollo TaxID=110799 RepID=A0A8S3XR25_PARAO|nr:unnamed protein product [Parnassius apollo]
MEYFRNLEETLKDVAPSNILNFDEKNLTDDPGSSKCIFRRGVKYPERVLNSTKGAISLMFSVTANGSLLPIYVVYKAENLYSEWIQGGPRATSSDDNEDIRDVVSCSANSREKTSSKKRKKNRRLRKTVKKENVKPVKKPRKSLDSSTTTEEDWISTHSDSDIIEALSYVTNFEISIKESTNIDESINMEESINK